MLLSHSSLLKVALFIGSTQAGALTGSVTCPASAPVSCHNSTVYENTCCFNYPGGDLLQTQFWDTNPSTGPADSWTIHGLWPDNCDGTYEQYCDATRQYTNITAILQKDAPCLLQYMQKYWKDYQGNDESFWEHEWGKHGTCISTLEPSCYPNHQPTEEVLDYFTRAVSLFKSLPSYQWLAAAGIVPSTTKTYTLAEIQAALTAGYGRNVIINCSKNQLNELWYHYNVQGSVQSGSFIPVDPVGSASTCPSTGIEYLPKYQTATTTLATMTTTKTPATGTASTTIAAPSGLPSALSGKGQFFVSSPGVSDGGFLIGVGAWYRNGGTPATYTATPNADGLTFVLNSSKGKCAIQSDSTFTCATSISAGSNFGFDGTYLTYDGSSTFYAAAVPSGITQGPVYAAPHAVSLQAAWVSV